MYHSFLKNRQFLKFLKFHLSLMFRLSRKTRQFLKFRLCLMSH